MTRLETPHPATGILLAALVSASWLAIHLGGIFLWQWTPATLPVAAMLVIVRARLNRAIGTVMLGAYAALSYRALLPKHLAHHAAPGTPSDPDFHPGEPRRLVPWFMRFFRGYYTHGQIVRITIVALLYMLLGASLINIVMFWAVPAVLALIQLFVFGTYLPHRHADDDFVDDHRARSNRLSPLGSLATCFHFGGYHHEHHLSPGTPWWRLPSARRDGLGQTDALASRP